MCNTQPQQGRKVYKWKERVIFHTTVHNSVLHISFILYRGYDLNFLTPKQPKFGKTRPEVSEADPQRTKM